MSPLRPGQDLFLWILGAAFLAAMFKTAQVMNEHEAAISILRDAAHGPRVADATAHFNILLQMLTDAKLHPDLNSFAINWLSLHLEQLPSINDWREFLNYLESLDYNNDGLQRLGDTFSKFFPPKGGSGSNGPNLVPR
jgi:hypothetical protein